MSGNEAVTLVATRTGAASSEPPEPSGRRLALARPAPSGPTSGGLGVAVVGDDESVRQAARGWSLARGARDGDRAPRLVALAGSDSEEVEAAADQHGWQDTAVEWRRAVERDDVDVVHVCVPADVRPVVVATALEAGKHVLCEVPIAASVEGARAMAGAALVAAEQGVWAGVAAPLRRLPAVVLARRLVAEGRIGPLRHVRVRYEQDWLVDPQTPLSWRLQRERAGSGALGELGAHVVDLAGFVTGEPVLGASALTETFVRERPLPGDVRGLRSTPGAWSGPVTVDDAAVLVGRLGGGALAVLEATRVAAGRRSAVRLEIDGSDGRLVLDSEEPDVLHLLDVRAPDPGRVRLHAPSVLADEPTSRASDVGAAGGPEAALLADVVTALAAGEEPATPTLAEALAVHELLDAASSSGRAEFLRPLPGQVQPTG